jgi:hypothetical protein
MGLFELGLCILRRHIQGAIVQVEVHGVSSLLEGAEKLNIHAIRKATNTTLI